MANNKTNAPISLWRLLKSRLKKRANAKLFGGNDALFKRVLKEASVYAEYGCGASTIWVSNNTPCEILSVDSSEPWIKLVAGNCKDQDKLHLHFADMGRTGDFGRPKTYDFAENFADYTDWVWQQKFSPDTVLIDGRFRVCCFLTSLLQAKEGARILFDDYTNREHYHIVERFIKPIEKCGRQALFLVPGKESLDRREVELFKERFRYVFD